jgi:small subunit ribosomal protein S1
VKNIAEKFKVGDKLPLSVVEFDKDSKKIVLSVVEYLKGKESKIVEEYASSHKIQAQTLGDVATISGQTPSGDTSIPTEN